MIWLRPARARWIIASFGVTLLGCGAWLVYSDAAPYRSLARQYLDKYFLKETLREWGVLAPILFMALQALQVISPISGDATGFLGGYLFGAASACPVFSSACTTCPNSGDIPSWAFKELIQ